jgi:hypothetical protein
VPSVIVVAVFKAVSGTLVKAATVALVPAVTVVMLVAVVGKPLLPVKGKVPVPPLLILLTVTKACSELVKVQVMAAPVITLVAGMVRTRVAVFTVATSVPASPVQFALVSA